MSFGLYLAGFIIVIAGLIYGARLLHMPAQWITVVSIVLLGVGILKGEPADSRRRTGAAPLWSERKAGSPSTSAAVAERGALGVMIDI